MFEVYLLLRSVGGSLCEMPLTVGMLTDIDLFFIFKIGGGDKDLNRFVLITRLVRNKSENKLSVL